MSDGKRYVSNKKERVTLSDILPYETPVVFSNRYFYDFLTEYEIELNQNTISWNSDRQEIKHIIELLFGLNDNLIKSERDGKIVFERPALRTIPLKFKISHKQSDFRELSVAHPLNQLSLVEFYDNYKELILYYANESSFSIRRPHKIAKYSYHKDKTHFKNLAHDHEHLAIETYSKEYENLKTFFAYEEVSNVYKFYESYKFHRCEKKYNKLLKFDIAKCFDSIYTHSITWALLNKEIVKDEIFNKRKYKHDSFPEHFDTLMQNVNHGETNGIIIGPEFSRIFAELILQQIDKEVIKKLAKKETPIRHKVDYEVFRYVDDYFVFFNENEVRDEIVKSFKLKLNEYNLYISDTKSKLFEKPIITDITRAKLRLTDLLDQELSFKRKTNSDEKKEYSFYVSSNRLITKFKTIIKETDISYKDVMNYTLACIDRKVRKLIKIYSKASNKQDLEEEVTKTLIGILDFSFFLYSVAPRVNTTIKICLIVSHVIKFAKIKGNFSDNNKHLIFKKIYDEIFLVLRKYKSQEHIQIETLYLLIALNELGREYRLDKHVLSEHFGIDLDNKKCEYRLNYFSIVVLLFYIGQKKRYSKVKRVIKNHILGIFQKISDKNRSKNAELTLLFFDLISCPYLKRRFKNKLFDIYGIDGSMGRIRSAIINTKDYWFTKWTNFDFGMALEAKKSEEVY